MFRMVSTKEKISSLLTLKNSCDQPSNHIGMESLPLTRRFQEEHNEIYCDLPSTFILDKFALQKSLINLKTGFS